MPLYEYLCESCGRTIEVIQSFSEAPLSLCDRCGGALKKLLSSPAFQFKGSGWYVSDYGRPGPAPATDAPSKEGGSPKDAGSSTDAAGSGGAPKETAKKDP
jgi:putative FmdB family regulatory protein